MENIRDFLRSIGFGKNETEVYVALVEQGQSSVLQLAKQIKIHRSNIYDALRNLIRQGLVYEINQSTKLFYARPLHSLIDYWKHREAELIEIVKDYETKVSSKASESRIKMSQGAFAAREALFSLLASARPIKVYGIPTRAVEVMGPILKDFHKERIQKKISMKHIYNSECVDRVRYLNKFKHTEARILPKKYDSDATTLVCGDKVIVYLWSREITVLEIDDENMAQPYENYFDILWSKARVV